MAAGGQLATSIVMPQMGYDMQEGTVVRWLIDEGAAVELGEAIAEIETVGRRLQTQLLLDRFENSLGVGNRRRFERAVVRSRNVRAADADHWAVQVIESLFLD